MVRVSLVGIQRHDRLERRAGEVEPTWALGVGPDREERELRRAGRDAGAGDLARAQALGATEATSVTVGASSLSAEICDPDGNRLSLIQWIDPGSPMTLRRLPHADALSRFSAAMGSRP